MPDEVGIGGERPASGQSVTSAPRRRRSSVSIVIVSVVMFVAMATYFLNGISILLDLGAFSGRLTAAAVVAGRLTPEGSRLILAAVFLLFGVIALAVLIGFILKRRWAWTAAMTWTAISLAVDLVAYFRGEPRYLSMFVGVVLLLVLNQGTLHREFKLER